MPRTRGSYVENSVIRGLITEATGLTFPENAFTDGDNIVINLDGSVERRLGIDIEPSFSSSSQLKDNYAVSEFFWENVAGSGDRNFVVVQIGSTLHFYNVLADGVLSDHKIGTTISLAPFELDDSEADACQFATGDGKLFVFHPTCRPFYVTFAVGAGTLSATGITVLIRDFEGVDDGLAIDNRPNTLSDAHEYNLYNQGWADDVLVEDDPITFENPVVHFESQVGDYPSNVDVWWLYKSSAFEFKPAETDSGGNSVGTIAIGNSPAPKGHFILNPFDTNRSTAHADIGTVTETTCNPTRPSTGAFFAGRVWYSGVHATGYQTKVYFSQIIERDAQIGQCYQANDPTSENLFDLLPNDGGVISIQDCGTIIKLFPMNEAMLVMATNGIWAISGSQGVGFTANDFSVTKISGTGVMSATSIVSVEGAPAWWNQNGIWAARPGEVGVPQIVSLTERTIQTYFNAIPATSKKYAKAAYNPLTKTIQWLWKSEAPENINQRTTFDRILNFNVVLNAFYPYSVSLGLGTANPAIQGVVAIQNPLIVTSVDRRIFYYVTAYVGSGPGLEFTFSREYRTTYMDWQSVPNGAGFGAEDYDSYFITGYKILNGGNKDFQNNYVSVFMANPEDSSLFISGLWDWTTTELRRWSVPQQCYRYSDGFSNLSTRLKIRGHGKALQLKFYSEEGLPFKFIGYAVEVSGNSTT